MSAYKMPDSAYKRLSFRAPDYGLLYNLTKRILPAILIILGIITLCVLYAYSLNGRAVPRQFVVGMSITAAIFAVILIVLSAIYCCRPKCAGKHNLRLESPAAPETTTIGWDGIGPSDFYDRPKQMPAVARRARESAGFGDLFDKIKQVIKEWRDEPYRMDNVRARAPAHASRGRDTPASRYTPHTQYDRRREDMVESEDLYRRQRDRDYRGDPPGAHQAYCESDDNRSQDADNTEVEPPRAMLRHDYHHHNVLPRELDRMLNVNNVYLKIPTPAHNPRR
ncbi:hypothetical protein VC83_01797 [Pseudogymnoascus destructans]|uniref:Uncharacterized protein n=1 Tax=Pseudogymnoascus destructans TaxID=655981 RepID=A0A177AJ38_9PEZI|nr:uncharacterized protein VC83_01797 [Pseudogymnoascus destructans]OAF61790.2 hypothetical protein VC83_01797 [Pseudogymnoascus destructans]